MILKGYLFSIMYAALCLLASLVVYKLGMPKKYSRKIVHILVGFEWVILYNFVGPSYHFLIVCLIFLALLTVAYLTGMMPMISSEDDNAPGTVYYAVAMSIMAVVCLFVPDMILPFGIGVFCTSFGDGFAGMIGQLAGKINVKVYRNKSLVGMVANLLFSFLSAYLMNDIFNMGLELWHCIVIALFAVELECVTPFGLDNISITVGTSFMAYAFINYSFVNSFIVPIILTLPIIAVVTEKKVLTRGGLLLAILLDAVVSLIFGNIGFILLALFLFGSVAIDKLKAKGKEDDVTKKDGCRDAVQVMANGLVPMMMAVMFSLTLNVAFVVGYVAALAEAFADTAASGVGVFSKSTYDIFKFRRCKRGISGGVSILGTLAALVVAFVIPVAAMMFSVISLEMMLIAAVAAFLGTVFDSMLGSLLQVKFVCTVCGELTEKDVHCRKITKKHSGFAFFDNDVVNLFSGAFAAVFAAAITSLLLL